MGVSTQVEPQNAVRESAMRETSTMRLGQRLRRARLARNLTQGEVARNQFSVSYVSAVERGQIRPSLGALEKLAERLQVPLTDLLGEGGLDNLGPSPAESREASNERVRDEIDARLREAQILSRQGKADAALDILLRMSSQHLSLREAVLQRWHLTYCYVALGRAEDARREASEALPMAERLGDAELIERVRNELGNAYSMLHSHALALDNYRASLAAIEQGRIQDPTFKLNVLYNIGNQYWHRGEFENAIGYLQQAAALAPDIINPEGLGAIYWVLSLSYGSKGDTAQAKMYALRSIGKYEEAGNRRVVAQVYNRLGRAYAQAGQVGDALAQLRTAYEIASGQQDARGIAEAQRSLATVYLQEQRIEDAEEAAQEALDRADAMSDPLQQADSHLVMARVREAQEDLESAEQHYTQAVDLLGTTQSNEHVREAYAQFSSFLERRGDNKRAFEMLKQAFRAGVPESTSY